MPGMVKFTGKFPRTLCQAYFYAIFMPGIFTGIFLAHFYARHISSGTPPGGGGPAGGGVPPCYGISLAYACHGISLAYACHGIFLAYACHGTMPGICLSWHHACHMTSMSYDCHNSQCPLLKLVTCGGLEYAIFMPQEMPFL